MVFDLEVIDVCIAMKIFAIAVKVNKLLLHLHSLHILLRFLRFQILLSI